MQLNQGTVRVIKKGQWDQCEAGYGFSLGLKGELPAGYNYRP